MSSLSIIIPCYNESNRLADFFNVIKNNLHLKWEWIFVDDGSTDDTANKINSLCKINPELIKLIRLDKNRGKGFAVREGILKATKKRRTNPLARKRGLKNNTFPYFTDDYRNLAYKIKAKKKG